MSVQQAIKQLRSELGLTQSDFARKVSRAYVTVNRWENGKDFPSRENAKTILALAKDSGASTGCISYLEDVLKPESKRCYSAAALGFPDIDRNFLFQLADDSMNALYVIEAKTYKLLYVNRKAEQNAAQFALENGIATKERKFSEQTDRRCFHYFGNKNEPCSFCPLAKFQANGFRDEVISLPESGKKLLLHAKKTKMNERRVYVVYLTDITQSDAERLALYELTNEIESGVGIYHVFYDGHIELGFMNRQLYKMFDEERRSALLLKGNTDLCLVHPDDKPLLTEKIKKSTEEKRNLLFNIRMKLEDGQYHLIELNCKIISRDKEKTTYFCKFAEQSDKSEENRK